MKATNEFYELQELWNSQRVDNESMDLNTSHADSIISKLKSLQTRQDRINRLKLLAISLILLSTIPSIFRLNLQGDMLITVVAGFSIILVNLIVFFTYYLRNQLRVSKLPFGESTEKFLDSAIQSLNKQNSIFRIPFLLFILGMLMGLNIMLLGMIDDADAYLRIQIHGLMSIFLLSAAFMGYRIRHYRTRQEVMPIIKALKEAKENLSK